jgi:micrococcal nuclease
MGVLWRRGTAGAILLLVAALAALLAGGAGHVAGPDRPAAGSDPRRAPPVSAHVSRVIDGDTIEIELDGAEEDVRYIGVDTPETVKPDTPVQCYGPEASAFNHRFAEGHDVELAFDRERRDVYGRLLAYVYVDGTLVNAELVRRGLARTLEIEPNTAMADRFDRLQSAAAGAGRGLWGSC